MKDLYKILEINTNSSSNEIKSSYKKLALKYHPDRSGGDEDKFKEITEAYSILSDTKKKNDYDKFGIIGDINTENMEDIINKMFGFGNNDINDILNDFNFPVFTTNSMHSMPKPKIFINIHKTSFNPNQNINSNSNQDTLNNITNILDNFMFDNIFSNESKINESKINESKINESINKEKKLEYDNIELKINLDDIIKSGKKLVKYKINDICSNCNGTCAFNKNDIIKCLSCNGLNINCLSCGGHGIIYKSNRRCLYCKNGYLTKETEFNIVVPKGVPENHILVVKNKGSYNKTNKNYNHIKLKFIYDLPTNIQIIGNAVFVNVDITLPELLCGFKKNVDFGSNNFEIKMDTYFDPTDVITYSKMGLPKYKDEEIIGDVVIKFNVIFPKSDDTNIHKYHKIFKKMFRKI